MQYEWYVDVFFLMNFLMDVIGILVAAIVCNVRIQLFRMFLICGISVICSILLLVILPRYGYYSLLVHAVLNPLMTALIFKSKEIGKYLRLLLTVYIVFLFVGGAQEWLQVLFPDKGNLIILFSGILAALTFVLYWQRQKTMQYVCTVDLWLAEKKVTVTAYCDSGNLLRDPQNGQPVSILEQKILEQWNTQGIERKKIPYHTISDEQSMLEVVVLDRMDIYMKGTMKQIKAPELGLHAEKIMENPPVQMLLHASYMGR